VVTKFLDSPAPLTMAEYLKMRPNAVQAMVQALESVGKKSNKIMLAGPVHDENLSDE
jgi:hypothetical protein